MLHQLGLVSLIQSPGGNSNRFLKKPLDITTIVVQNQIFLNLLKNKTTPSFSLFWPTRSIVYIPSFRLKKTLHIILENEVIILSYQLKMTKTFLADVCINIYKPLSLTQYLMLTIILNFIPYIVICHFLNEMFLLLFWYVLCVFCCCVCIA